MTCGKVVTATAVSWFCYNGGTTLRVISKDLRVGCLWKTQQGDCNNKVRIDIELNSMKKQLLPADSRKNAGRRNRTLECN